MEECNYTENGKVEAIYAIYLNLENIVRHRLQQQGLRNISISKVISFQDTLLLSKKSKEIKNKKNRKRKAIDDIHPNKHNKHNKKK